MIPGMWGAPLKIFNAFLPPMQYSESPYGVGYIKGGEVLLLILKEISTFRSSRNYGFS